MEINLNLLSNLKILTLWKHPNIIPITTNYYTKNIN